MGCRQAWTEGFLCGTGALAETRARRAVHFPPPGLPRGRRAVGEGKGGSAPATGGEKEAGPEERLRARGRRAGAGRAAEPLPVAHGGAAAAEAGRGRGRWRQRPLPRGSAGVEPHRRRHGEAARRRGRLRGLGSRDGRVSGGRRAGGSNLFPPGRGWRELPPGPQRPPGGCTCCRRPPPSASRQRRGWDWGGGCGCVSSWAFFPQMGPHSAQTNSSFPATTPGPGILCDPLGKQGTPLPRGITVLGKPQGIYFLLRLSWGKLPIIILLHVGRKILRGRGHGL